MMIDGVGTGQRHELYPLAEEKEGKAQTETVPGERPQGTGSIKAGPVKTAVVTETPPIDPEIKELGDAVGKRLTTYSDEKTMILKDGQTGRMKRVHSHCAAFGLLVFIVLVLGSLREACKMIASYDSR